jgi:hypothetical protein
MDKGKKRSKKNKNRNKEAVEFILANRDAEDPNFNNPNVNKKILLQVNKDEDLTEEQKKIIESIPKIQRGIFDENAQLKLMTQNNDITDKNDNDEIKKEKKGVNFDFDKNEIINFDKKKKVGELQKEKLINDIKNKKIDISKIEDEEKVKEIFKNLKINAKIVEYNELGLKKDTDPELLKLVTDKEFIEGVDIFVPAPKDNNGKIIKEYDNDMNEENMNEEYKELEKELQSDDEDEKIIKSAKEEEKEKKEEEINTSSKEENLTENKNIEIKGDLEDDFVLLANEGELPVELITEQEKENSEKNNNQNKNSQDDNIKNNEFSNFNSGKSTYKYITKEEIEYVQKKFLLDENDENISGKKKGNFIGKKEFNDAINEILNSKKDQKDKNKIETVMGLKKSILDEEEFEEYELSEEDEDLKENNVQSNKEINNNNKNLDNKKLSNIISNKEKEENFEEEDEEEEKEEDYKPNIKIEYVSREDEPAPFDKDDKIKKKRKNKKEFKKSRTKQYEQLKENGELSDESFDKDKLDELLHDEEYIKKTKELIDSNIDEDKNIVEIDKEIETKYNLEPKIQKDITETNDKIINLPKVIKQEKREKNFNKKQKTEEEQDNKEEEKDENKKISNNNFEEKDRKKETKEDKALRKKLLKMERKERRAEKKKLKNAFKEEKVSQQRQIAQSNKIVRYGLSIKDI